MFIAPRMACIRTTGFTVQPAVTVAFRDLRDGAEQRVSVIGVHLRAEHADPQIK